MTTRQSALPDSYFPSRDDWVAMQSEPFTLELRHTALVVVDMQYYSSSRDTGYGAKLKEWGREDLGKYRFDRIEQLLIPNVQRLSAFLRQHGMRVVYLTVGSTMPDYSDVHPHLRKLFSSYNGRLGTRESEVLDEIKPLPGDVVVHKTTPGAFNSSNIDAILRGMDLRDLLFAGVSTNGCVEGTARDAADRGYRCIMVEDCCGTDNDEFHRMALVNFQRSYGRMATTEQVIAELSELVKDDGPG